MRCEYASSRPWGSSALAWSIAAQAASNGDMRLSEPGEQRCDVGHRLAGHHLHREAAAWVLRDASQVEVGRIDLGQRGREIRAQGLERLVGVGRVQAVVRE